MLERARQVVAATGIEGTPPHLAENIAYCALCRGDLVEVVAVLEDQIERYGGVSLRLYMDHHVRGEITRGLRQRGVDVLTAFEELRARFSVVGRSLAHCSRIKRPKHVQQTAKDARHRV